MNLTPRITDHQVADLPLARSRVELLEEIVRTPVATSNAVRGPHRTPPGWVIVVAAAAAVLAVAVLPAWLGGSDRASDVDDARGTASASAPPAATGHRAVLDAAGWRITTVYEGHGEGELQYARDGARVDISWRPGRAYDDYYADRRDIGPGTTVELLGAGATMWAYSDTDHTVIGPVADGHFLEVRGSGLDRAEFIDLLNRLRRVDEAGFAAAVHPHGIVTPSETPAHIDRILADVTVPDGFDPARIKIEGFNARYHVIAAATGAVTCAWVEEYAAGNRAAATEAMAGSREWDALREIVDEGDWAEIGVWSVANDMAAGTPASLLRERSGC